MVGLDLSIFLCFKLNCIFFYFIFFLLSFLLVNIARVNYFKWGFLDLVNYIPSFRFITRTLKKISIILLFLFCVIIFLVYLGYICLVIFGFCLDVTNLFYNELINCNIYSINNNVCIMDKIMNLHNYIYFYALLFFITNIVIIVGFLYKKLFVPYIWPSFIPQPKLRVYDYVMSYILTFFIFSKKLIYKYQDFSQSSGYMSQNVSFILIGCIAVYLGTYIFEYMFLGDLEAYIKMYDQAAREKCARDGTFFDVQYYEGIYAYWRIRRSVHEGALKLIRVGSLFYFSYTLVDMLKSSWYPKDDPKGPGSDPDGGSDSNMVVTSLKTEKLNPSIISNNKVFSNQIPLKIKDTTMSFGIISHLEDLVGRRYSVKKASAPILKNHISQIKFDFVDLTKHIQAHILEKKMSLSLQFDQLFFDDKNSIVELPEYYNVRELFYSFVESQKTIALKSLDYNVIQEDLDNYGISITKNSSEIKAVRELKLVKFLLKAYVDAIQERILVSREDLLSFLIKRHIFYEYGLRYNNKSFYTLSLSEYNEVCESLKSIQTSFLYSNVQINLECTHEELVSILTNSRFTFASEKSVALSNVNIDQVEKNLHNTFDMYVKKHITLLTEKHQINSLNKKFIEHVDNCTEGFSGKNIFTSLTSDELVHLIEMLANFYS